MARKLKSDKVLFLATLLLVCAERRHGLQRLGAGGAGALPAALSVPDKQAMWAALGLAMLVDRDAHRLPHLPRAGVHLDAASASSALALVAVLFRPPVNSARRWFGIGGFGIQPSELAKLAAIFFIAAMLERRMHRINELALLAAADRLIVVLGLVGLILLEPDFGTSMSLLADRRRDGVRRRPQLPLHRRRRRCVALPALYVIVMGAAYRRRRTAGVPRSVGRPARRRLPDHPVAHRGRHRRRLRARG